MKLETAYLGVASSFVWYAYRKTPIEQFSVQVLGTILGVLIIWGISYLSERIEVRWRPRPSPQGEGQHG